MILLKKTSEQSLTWVAPTILFLTGITFSGVIWLIDIFIMISSSISAANYFISMPFSYFSYWIFCVLNFTGFCVLGFILIFKRTFILLSLALIISCGSIAINTILLKKILRYGHRDYITAVEQYLQGDNAYPHAVRINEEQYKQSVKQWNLIEKEKIKPNEDLYGIFLKRLAEFKDPIIIECWSCDGIITEDQIKKLIDTGNCPFCNNPIIE